VALLIPSLGCSVEVAESDPNTSEAPANEDPKCTASFGTLEGHAYRWYLPPAAGSEVAGGIDVLLGHDMETLHAQTDADGLFSVLVEAGIWTLGGDDNAGCISSMPVTVEVKACHTTTEDVLIDICAG
jgi:hypothetical protein